jgi:L-iditol 2-dehydrogenase
MQGAVVQGPGEVDVQTVPDPVLAEGQVMVQMICSAICGSDLHAVLDGVPALACPGRPGAPGHEGVGLVVESRTPDLVEQQLVLTVPDRRSAGAFADFQAIPSRFALPIPADVAPELMVCAQQYGTVLYAMRRFWPDGGGRLGVVLGLGPAGIQFVCRLKEIGFDVVIGSDPVAFRRQMAADLGCDLVIDPTTTDPHAFVFDQSAGRGAELVVEATGRNAGRLSALGLVEERGRVGFFGLPEAHAPLVLPYAEVFERKPTIVVSDGAQHEPGLRSFREAIDYVGKDQSVPARLVTHHFALGQFEAALHAAAAREGVGKVVLHNGPSPLVRA